MLKLLDEEPENKANRNSRLEKYSGLYTQIGLCYFIMENNEKALHYYRKSIDLNRTIYSTNKNFPIDMQELRLYHKHLGA
jgi:tetratricopeptide (TPR) repeat protein